MDIRKLREWTAKGNRSVSIDIVNYRDEYEVTTHCYDYDIEAGAFIESDGKLPSRDELLKKKRDELESKLNRLKS